ncbi:serine/threonine protein kinase [Polytolypa hystricis UAMH7299]|uniref:Serine/threonine protein kinase n=1 Tax=Polytolypa hystricis (strain UAMH7299) TaxID=1447883 RepID=A0A2B7Z171_POLH7|nr:serine/threonine protein kinase [Polytolypa hystricis UAMH7299]
MTDPELGVTVVVLCPRSPTASAALDSKPNALFVARAFNPRWGGSKVLRLTLRHVERTMAPTIWFGSDTRSCDVILRHANPKEFSVALNLHTGICYIHRPAHKKRFLVIMEPLRFTCRQGGYTFSFSIPNRGQYETLYQTRLGSYLKNTLTTRNSQFRVISTYPKPLSFAHPFKTYLTIQKLGSGSFGHVSVVTPLYGAGDVRAMKQSQGNGSRQMLENEIAILQRLAHPNIVKYLDYNQPSKPPALLMEYFLVALKQGLSALSYFRSARIIHRDVKPQNIVVQMTNPMIVKFVDFGLAIVPSAASQFQGTVRYMAPEVLMRGTYSFPIDVWALSLTVLQIFRGLPQPEVALFERVMLEKNHGAGQINMQNYITATHQILSELPVPLNMVLSGMLHPTPEFRHTPEMSLQYLPNLEHAADAGYRQGLREWKPLCPRPTRPCFNGLIML